MTVARVTEHVQIVDLGEVKVFIIMGPEGLTLIDTGMPDSVEPILEAVRSLGRSPEDVTDIVVTHCHPDHAGGMAGLKQATGATLWMHPADAALVARGEAFRPSKVSPGLRNRLFYRLVIKRGPDSVPPVVVDGELHAGDTLPIAGGLRVLGTPGHTEGHVCLLWPGDGGVLFVGDAIGRHHGRLRLSAIYEDHTAGRESLAALAREAFDTACFAHAEPIVGHAADEFQRF